MMIRIMLEGLYRSPIGRLMSAVARAWSALKKPRMIYGYYDHTARCFRKYTRISDSVVIMSTNRLSMGDHVWVWHHSILDATEGLTIEEGCQIGAWVGIFTHGSQIAIRLYGREYVNVPARDRIGYTRGSVTVGAYAFIGAGSMVLPGITIGRGCIIGAGSLVNKDVPDYSIALGNPARVVGSTKDLDAPFLQDERIRKTYYHQPLLDEILGNGSKRKP